MELLPDTNTALKAWAPVHFHHGAAHLTAHVVPLEDSTISPGQTRHAQIVFETPICALPGDRSSFATRKRSALWEAVSFSTRSPNRASGGLRNACATCEPSSD